MAELHPVGNSFSDEEIKKFLDENGYMPCDDDVIPEADAVAIVVNEEERDSQLAHALSTERRRRTIVVAICVFLEILHAIMIFVGSVGALYFLGTATCAVQEVFFPLVIIMMRAERNLRKIFTNRVEDGAEVLQKISKRFKLQWRKSHHLLVKYRIDGRSYLKIFHVHKSEYDWLRIGDHLDSVMYVPGKPKSAIYSGLEAKQRRKRLIRSGWLLMLLHLVNLGLIFGFVQDGDDSDSYASYYITFTVIGIATGLCAYLFTIRRVLRRKLSDYVDIQEATPLPCEKEPPSVDTTHKNISLSSPNVSAFDKDIV